VHPVADRSGFTLIELLVAMVIGAIVITSLFQLISGQGRFVELQGAHEEVQQNTRAAIELIGSELRTLPGGSTLVMAAEDSATLRTARVWGVVCAVGGLNSIDVVLPAVAGATYTANSGTGALANVGSVATPTWTNAVTVSGIGPAAATCGGAALPGGTERRTLTVSSIPQSGGAPASVGSPIYLYEQVTYRTGVSAGIPGKWIQRRVGNTATSTNQPMAGPIDESTGLKFRYFAGAATTPLTTPILDAATRASVTRVVVSVDAVSQSSFGGETVSKADTVVVTLRNRLP
jgi:prepilin-type N-terminal cleavage/methylation domain-containing protein